MNVKPRLVRPIEPPLGLYFRAGHNDHSALLELIHEGSTGFSGIVVSATRIKRHAELIRDGNANLLETVLDPHSAELATPGGRANSSISSLPWAGQALHSPGLLAGPAGAGLCDAVADVVASVSASAVLAPSHFLTSADDPWGTVDASLVTRLRERLDKRGRQDCPIYYPLALPRTVLVNAAERGEILDRLRQLPIDAVWLRVHPFGASSGAVALRSYIMAARAVQELGVPIVAERTGTAGLALLAFGAVGGIEGGVTVGERFDMSPLQRGPRSDTKVYLMPPRIYVAELGVFLKRDDARRFFSARGSRAYFACRNSTCCRRGFESTLENPRRHFLRSRIAEVSRYSKAPLGVRGATYLESFLRPATDLAVRAVKIRGELDSVRLRLEKWRQALGALQRAGNQPTRVAVPRGGRVAHRRPA